MLLRSLVLSGKVENGTVSHIRKKKETLTRIRHAPPAKWNSLCHLTPQQRRGKRPCRGSPEPVTHSLKSLVLTLEEQTTAFSFDGAGI